MTPVDFGNDTSAPNQELGARMDSIESTPPTGAPREDLITKATSFLLNPKVTQDSELEQRAFLQRKGLSPVEIDMAFQRRMALVSAPAALAGLMGPPRRNGSWADFFHRLAMSVAVLGSASYALYWFFKTYVEPRLKAENRTEQILTEVLLELRNKNEVDAENARKTISAIADLRSEMGALKKMLVARNQFPVPPSLTGVPVKIPSWQQNHQTSTSQTEDAKVAPPKTDKVGSENAFSGLQEVFQEPKIEKKSETENNHAQKSIDKDESSPDSGISQEATSSDGESQTKGVKDKPRNPKKKRSGHS